MISKVRHLGPITIEKTIKKDNKEYPNPAYYIADELSSVIGISGIKNIAIAGNYGAGKSSVVKTAIEIIEEKERKDIKWWQLKDAKKRSKFLNISLALLNTSKNKEDDEEENQQETKSNDENELELKADEKGDVKVSLANTNNELTTEQIEYSILQQILYYDVPCKTPKSRFFRLTKNEWWQPFLGGLLIILFFISICILYNPELFRVDSLVDRLTVAPTTKFWVDIFAIIYIAFLFLLLLIWATTHARFKINRVKIKDTELTVDHLSVFNQYLDEIIYFFASTRYNVVIFEDLDRFADSTTLFGKLRELNRILNNSLYLNKKLKRDITFVYSVRDNLFDSNNRVKFFDYIIPVVPVINTSNAYDKLIEYLDDEDIKDLDCKDLLNLCEFFEDLRLIINIVNEFNLYKRIINLELFNLSKRKLFGIVVYKNYYPDDFAKMYNKRGVVANILDNKESILKEIHKSQENDLEREKHKLEFLEKESKKWEQTVRLGYVTESKNQSKYGSALQPASYARKSDGVIYSFEKVLDDPDAFKLLENNELFLLHGSNRYEINDFSLWQKLVNAKSYRERLLQNPHLEDVINQRKIVANYQLSKVDLSDSFGKILRCSPDILTNYLNKRNKKGYLFIPEKNQDMLRFMLLHDFIDERYGDYITYFYPNTLNESDSKFVKNVTSYDKESLPYDYKLSSPSSIAIHFDVRDYLDNHRLFNVDLVSYLASVNDQKENRSALIENVINTCDFDFIISIYESKNIGAHEFLKEMLISWNLNKEITRLEKDDLRIPILREIYLRYSNIEDSKMIDNSFKNWIDNNYGFVASRVGIIDEERMIDFFNAYNISFRRINLSTGSKILSNDIIVKSRYSVNTSNLENIAMYLNVLDGFKKASFSTLSNSSVHELSNAVKSRLPEYIKAFPKSSIYEDDAAKLMILEDDNLSYGTKKNYLKNQNSRIQQVSQVKDKYLGFVFENSLVESTWENLSYYCFEKGKPLPIAFIKNNRLVGFNRLDNTQQDEIKRKWLYSEIVPLSIYGDVIDSIGYVIQSLPSDMNIRYVSNLISHKLLLFNVENYKIVRSNYTSLSSDFIINNIDVYLSSTHEYEISSIEMIRVLRFLAVKKRQAEYLSSEPFFIGDVTSEIAEIVCDLITSSKLRMESLNIQFLISVLTNLTSDSSRHYLGRKCLFELPYDFVTCASILKAMGGEYKRLLSANNYCWISKNNNNIRIAKYLSENGFCGIYQIVGNRIKIER